MSMIGKMLGFGRNEHYDRAIRLFDQGLFEEAVEAFGHVFTSSPPHVAHDPESA